MKKLQHIIMITLILIGLTTPALAQDQTDDFNVAAKHAIAIETTTGKVLYEKDATTPDGVASMTKILTAYMVYKAVDQGKINWDTEVGISDYPFNLTVDSEVSNIPLDSRKYTVNNSQMPLSLVVPTVQQLLQLKKSQDQRVPLLTL